MAKLAGKIKIWLDRRLGENVSSFLDQYTWRVLANECKPEMLNIPDYDLRYRKVLETPRGMAMGFYHAPDIEIDNFWNDGVGHIACGFFAIGNPERGNFYANQMDKLLVEETINGKKVMAMPAAPNHQGGYDWVDVKKDISQPAAGIYSPKTASIQ